MKHIEVWLMNGDEHNFTCEEVKKETIGNETMVKFIEGGVTRRYIQSHIIGFKEREEIKDEKEESA